MIESLAPAPAGWTLHAVTLDPDTGAASAEERPVVALAVITDEDGGVASREAWAAVLDDDGEVFLASDFAGPCSAVAVVGPGQTPPTIEELAEGYGEITDEDLLQRALHNEAQRLEHIADRRETAGDEAGALRSLAARTRRLVPR